MTNGRNAAPPHRITDREERLAEERLLLAAQTAMQKALNERGLRYRDLAKLMVVSEARVSQIFGDDAGNLTIRTIAKVFHHLEEVPLLITRTDFDRQLAQAAGEAFDAEPVWVFADGNRHREDFEVSAEVVADLDLAKEARRPATPARWAQAEATATRRAGARS